MHENVVVPADWLADRLEDVRVVDVREPWEYEGIGHLPGAVNVPFDRFRSADEADEGMLPGASTWTDLMERAGVSEDDTLVAYDDTHGVFAARFLVTAMLYGHGDLRLLNGDFSSWQRERRTTSDVPDPDPTEYAVREPTDSPLVGREEVESAIDSDAVLVDTRTPGEFAEGHLPGAVNVDWLELVDDESRGLKPRGELEALLEGYGVVPDERVVLYCNTARRISHTYVVLSYLGYDDVGFYEGSLTDWTAADGDLETGSD